MKMIELWNPVPKGSTSSPTKRRFRDQQISEPGLESQERQKSCAQLSLRGQFEEEGKRSMVLAFEKGVSARKEGIS